MLGHPPRRYQRSARWLHKHDSLKKVHTVESPALMSEIKIVHDLSRSREFINDVLNATVERRKHVNVPDLCYRLNVRGRVPDVLALQWHLQRLPNSSLNKRYQERGRVFNGIFSKHGSRFLASFQDQWLKLFDSTDPYNLRLMTKRGTETLHWSVLDVAFSSNERTVAYSGWINRVYIVDMYDLSVPAHHLELSHDNEDNFMAAFSIKFDNSGRRLLAGGFAGSIYLGDVETGQRICRIVKAHEDDIGGMAFVDDSGQVFVSGGDDAVLRVFDLRAMASNCESGSPVGCFPGHACGITYIDSKGDSRYLLSNSKDQTIRLWDLRRMAEPSAIESHLSRLRDRISYNWDYRHDSVPGEFASARELPPAQPAANDFAILVLRGHEVRQTLIRARFSPVRTTGQRFVYSGCSRGCWHLWDTLTGAGRAVQQPCHDVVRDVSWHPYEPVVMATHFRGYLKTYAFADSDEALAMMEQRCQDSDRDSSDGIDYEEVRFYARLLS